MTIVRGFIRNRQYLPALQAYGLTDKAIYIDGRGAETLGRCLDTFRGRPGKLLVAPDLRVFGQARAAVAQVMAGLERIRIRVVDVIHPQDETVSEMLQRAAVLIGRTRFGDRKMARRRGREGGRAKGQAAEQGRAEIAADWVIRNIANDPEISWETAVRIFGGRISESTLRRHYYGTVP